jgi:hypothetical protein
MFIFIKTGGILQLERTSGLSIRNFKIGWGWDSVVEQLMIYKYIYIYIYI